MSSLSRVIILGSGHVSHPIIARLAQRQSMTITVASNQEKELQRIAALYPKVETRNISVTDAQILGELFVKQDVVVSLVPAHLHPLIAQQALEKHCHYFSSSYLAAPIKELDAQVRAADLLFLNECGLDPGIDHMLAMQAIDTIKARGSTIEHFISYGGGLPAPEVDAEPWRYKFSWSPYGVLVAGGHPAVFRRQGHLMHKLPGSIFSHPWPVKIDDLPEFEAYPNRDSIKYEELYGLHNCSDMIRATLRYPGWSNVMQDMYCLGLLNICETETAPQTLRELFDIASENRYRHIDNTELQRAVCERIRPASFAKLAYLGLFSDQPFASGSATTLGMLSEVMAAALAYTEGERDMVLLMTEIGSRGADGKPATERLTFVDYATANGHTAMARSVSLPVAAAVESLIAGEIDVRGVHIPVDKAIYTGILDRLTEYGFHFRHSFYEI
jgi:saccharopine dehydrogenase-like NADP-dependent oxidoreductase